MLKRAKISVTRRKSKTIIFFLFLLIVANLVLSSISIKNATEESMKMARVSLGSEVILQTDMEKIRDEFIKLGQALKAAGLVESGVEAKIVIQNGEVLVNGRPELQRGKKLTGGEVISYNGQEIRIEK